MSRGIRLVQIFQTTTNPEEHCVVAVLDSRAAAEEAVQKLQESGIDLKKCSIVGREPTSEDHVVTHYAVSTNSANLVKMGAVLGGLWGFLGGSALFLIPGIGTVLVGGTLVAALVGCLEGAVIGGGMSALGTGFLTMGIPPHAVVDYEVAIKENGFLVILLGNVDDVAKAREALKMPLEDLPGQYSPAMK